MRPNPWRRFRQSLQLKKQIRRVKNLRFSQFASLYVRANLMEDIRYVRLHWDARIDLMHLRLVCH